MNNRIPMIDGDEVDALTRARHWYHWKPGERKRIKRKYRRRERIAAKREVQRHMERIHS